MSINTFDVLKMNHCPMKIEKKKKSKFIELTYKKGIIQKDLYYDSELICFVASINCSYELK